MMGRLNGRSKHPRMRRCAGVVLSLGYTRQ